MTFVASAGSHAYHPDTEHFVDNTQHHNPHFSSQHGLPDVSTQPGYYNPNAGVPHQMSCDIKPRLTKEQHDVLEAHFQEQSKPNTNVKKGFAEELGVSLDKVNNWFQNRRAKSKQDAKKSQGINLYNAQQQASLNFSSDSETSPAFASTEYFNMMAQCTAEDQMSNSISMGQGQQFQDLSPHGMAFDSTTPNEQFNGQPSQQQAPGDMLFDSPQEMNRRTLTQEQFNALAQSGNAMHTSNQYDPLPQFSGDMDVLQQVFPDLQNEFKQEFKQEDSFAFPAPMGAPLSSNDSSVPSTISEQSMFPSSTTMQEQGNLSATSSEWGDSRSSSVSLQHQDPGFQQMPPPAPAPVAVTQPTTASSQWQPGMSQPVDPSALQQQFREAQALRQQQQQQQQANAQAQAQAHAQNPPHQEQPLAWPADEAFGRRDSQNGAMLAQHMSSFAIQTPLPPQSATFKSPAPPGDMSSIAARRQRPRPAALPLSSLRSQSYSAAPQPRSPGHQTQQNLAAPGPLRRIRSSNVINGGVAQGRVMKPMPGSAQRSPLNWTFADAMNSPKAARHVSTSAGGNLAPPTPLSPSQEQSRPVFPPWQAPSGHFSRQASISETDAEHNMAMSVAVTSQNVSSPPHTPLYHHHHGQQSQQLSQARVGNTVITENTPPQSAPAAQQTFPANVFMVPQQNYSQPQQQSQPPQVPAFVPQQQQPFMNMPVPEQQFQMPAASYGPPQHFVVSAPEAAPAMPIQFGNGVPIVDAQGNMVLGFPPQMQPMQFAQHQPQHQMQFSGQQPQMHNPPQAGQYNFMTGPGIPQSMAVNAPMQKPPQPQSEFFVHEYTPPQDMKRSAIHRKPQVDNGPRSYVFANQGPENFGKDKVKKGSELKTATASSSPSSATSNS